MLNWFDVLNLKRIMRRRAYWNRAIDTKMMQAESYTFACNILILACNFIPSIHRSRALKASVAGDSLLISVAKLIIIRRMVTRRAILWVKCLDRKQC